VAKRVRYSGAILSVAVVACAAMLTASSRAALNDTPRPESEIETKPADRSCYVRGEDGLVRYYLEGPLREGELPYLQGLPITGADGKVLVRNEVPESAIPPRILQAPPCPPGKHHLS
jgi:hypothetical protein